MAVGCVGSQTFDQPMALSFTTVSGEQLLAFHKPTTPLQGIALYEEVMEPGLRAGTIAWSSYQHQPSRLALLNDSRVVIVMHWCMLSRCFSAESVLCNHQSTRMGT